MLPSSPLFRACLVVIYTTLVIACSIAGSMYIFKSNNQQQVSQSKHRLIEDIQYLVKAKAKHVDPVDNDSIYDYVDKRVSRLIQSQSRNSYELIDRSIYPRRAYATLTSFDPTYCKATYHLYRSLERTEAMHWQKQDELTRQSNDPSVYRSRVDREFDFVIMFVEGSQNQTNLFTDPFCSLLTRYAYPDSIDQTIYESMKHTVSASTFPHMGRVRYLPVASSRVWMDSNPRLKIEQANWQYALSKIHILNHSEYEKIFFIDSDAMVVKPLVYMFDRVDDMDLVVAMDTWHCTQHTFMNGGVWLARPSKLLFDSFLSYMRLNDNNQCLSGHMQEPVNELVNCVCGNWKAGMSRRPAIKCEFAAWFLDTFPQYTMCPDYQPELVEILHVAGRPKPWDEYATDCKHTDELYEGALVNQDHKFFTDRPACFIGMESLQTYYQCVSYWQGKGGLTNDVDMDAVASQCAIVAL